MAVSRRTIYLDHAATTPVLPEVFDSMKPYLTAHYGNPSSAYQLGERSANAIERTREIIAGQIHAAPEEIYFTSGGSESDNWALKGVADYNRIYHHQYQCHMMTSCIEHPAVLNSAKYLEKKGVLVDYLPVDKKGVVSLNEMKKMTNPYTILISVMYANNEIGTLEPIDEIGAFTRSHNIVFHTDAVQAFGQVPIDVQRSQIDLLSASAHKLGGPKGVGFLYIRKGCRLEPFIHGGGQESGHRSGTENVASIVGLGKACEIACKNMEQKIHYVKKMRDTLAETILREVPGSFVNGGDWKEEDTPLKRLPGNLNITLPGIQASELVAKLDAKGICISTASACSAHHDHPSHVLENIGLTEEEARSTIRLTLGTDNHPGQIPYVVTQLRQLTRKPK